MQPNFLGVSEWLDRPYTFIVLALLILLILILSPVMILRTPTEYTGMNPEELEGRLTSAYERVLTAVVDNIEHIESTTVNGTASGKIYLQPGASLDSIPTMVCTRSELLVIGSEPQALTVQKKEELRARAEHQSEGGSVMKNRIASIILLMSVFLCSASVIAAQTPSNILTSESPVLPMNIKFRYIPQYFEQSLEDDPRYARIEAIVDNGHCDVILLDKTTSREALYSTSDREVKVQAANGADAYNTRIKFTASSTIDSYPLFLIHFHDQFGQEVTWQFVVGDMVLHASPEIIPRTDSSGITLLYAPHRATGTAGTTLTIAERKYKPQSTRFNDALAAFYATDMTVSQILPGTDLWKIESGPVNGEQTARWNLTGEGGRQRTLELKQLSDTEAAIEQIDVNDPIAPQVVLHLERVNHDYELRSVSLQSHDNRLWIFFGPALPLPAKDTDDRPGVTFTVAENEQANIASGELQVHLDVDTEHLLWRFDAPNLARSLTFETGVNLIRSAGEQATCMSVLHETPACLEP